MYCISHLYIGLLGNRIETKNKNKIKKFWKVFRIHTQRTSLFFDTINNTQTKMFAKNRISLYTQTKNKMFNSNNKQQ